jgi:hypothetical protein
MGVLVAAAATEGARGCCLLLRRWWRLQLASGSCVASAASEFGELRSVEVLVGWQSHRMKVGMDVEGSVVMVVVAG